MRIFQSVWTKPLLMGNKSKILPFLKIAYVSAKSIKKCGYELVCYTDELGASLLKNYPYDEIIVVDIPENLNHGLFASIKYISAQNEPLGSVHLDCDVIIDKPCIYFNEGSDVLTQFIEKPVTYFKEKKFMLEQNKIPQGITVDEKSIYTPWCVAVIGFNNQDLKDKFLEFYFNAAKLYENIEIPNNITLDLVLEQAALPEIANQNNFKPQFVLNSDNNDVFYKTHVWAPFTRYVEDLRTGYRHFHANSKYSVVCQEVVNKQLSEKDIKIINSNFCQNINCFDF